MLKLLSFLLLFTSFSYTEIIKADYSVEFGIVGEVAQVSASIKKEKNKYFLKSTVKAVGLIATTMTQGLREKHFSKGHIKNGLLIVDKYQMFRYYGDYITTTIYSVNHILKQVQKHYIEWKNGKKVREYRKRLGYYSPDDMLILFLNLPLHIKEKYTPKHYVFKVVGADRDNGTADIIIPKYAEAKEMESLLGKPQEGEWLLNVIMHRKLYRSKNGSLDVKIGKEGFVDKAVLKDLIFFGDVRIIRQ